MKVKFFPANLQNKKPEKRILFVVTYRPIINSSINIVSDKAHLLNMSEEVRKTL